MGVFGTGNFDSDCSAEFLGDLCDELIAQVESAINSPSNLEAGEYWSDVVPSIIDLLLLFEGRRLFGSKLPSPTDAARWKAAYLDAWEASGKELKQEFYTERKRVLQRTFAKLIRRANRKD